MSQPVSVTVGEIVEYLKTGEKPVFTMNDIAEEFGVSKETVRKRTSELVERDGVREEKIGKANVYWYSNGEDESGHHSDPVEDAETGARDGILTPVRKDALVGVGRIYARVAVFVLLITALIASLVSLEAAAPETAAEIDSALTLWTVAGVEITLLDPFVVTLALWSLAPIVPVYGWFLWELGVIGE